MAIVQLLNHSNKAIDLNDYVQISNTVTFSKYF